MLDPQNPLGQAFRDAISAEITGFLTGLLTLTPFHQWRMEHTVHHSAAGDLDRRAEDPDEGGQAERGQDRDEGEHDRHQPGDDRAEDEQDVQDAAGVGDAIENLGHGNLRGAKATRRASGRRR